MSIATVWEKIVLNLISNAFKFTFAGEISVALREMDRAARLTVRDTGIGIPASQIEKLFDRFHRVEGARGRSFEGSGIGLALVRELVKLHNGDIAVESEEGRGTAFHVTIPLGIAHLPPERVKTASEETATASRSQTFVEEALRWLPGDAGDALLDAGAARDVPQGGAAQRIPRNGAGCCWPTIMPICATISAGSWQTTATRSRPSRMARRRSRLCARSGRISW